MYGHQDQVQERDITESEGIKVRNEGPVIGAEYSISVHASRESVDRVKEPLNRISMIVPF